MDKDYFEENLAEAKNFEWEQVRNNALTGHNHCIICLTPLPNKLSSTIYKSKNVYICSHCFEKFIMK